MMAMQEIHVIGVNEKRWLSAQDLSSVIRVVTVPVSLLLSLSTRTSYTHQSHMPAVRCSNECPTFLLLKFDDGPIEVFFSFSTSSSSSSKFIWFLIVRGYNDSVMPVLKAVLQLLSFFSEDKYINRIC